MIDLRLFAVPAACYLVIRLILPERAFTWMLLAHIVAEVKDRRQSEGIVGHRGAELGLDAAYHLISMRLKTSTDTCGTYGPA